jgi:hypothetical protein
VNRRCRRTRRFARWASPGYGSSNHGASGKTIASEQSCAALLHGVANVLAAFLTAVGQTFLSATGKDGTSGRQECLPHRTHCLYWSPVW